MQGAFSVPIGRQPPYSQFPPIVASSLDINPGLHLTLLKGKTKRKKRKERKRKKTKQKNPQVRNHFKLQKYNIYHFHVDLPSRCIGSYIITRFATTFAGFDGTCTTTVHSLFARFTFRLTRYVVVHSFLTK